MLAGPISSVATPSGATALRVWTTRCAIRTVLFRNLTWATNRLPQACSLASLRANAGSRSEIDQRVHCEGLLRFRRGGESARHPGARKAFRCESRFGDLLPSVMAFIGVPVKDRLPGTSSFQGAASRDACAEIGFTPVWSLIHGDYKLIDEGQQPLLFDLRTDPGERHNVASAQPKVLASLRATADSLTSPGDQPAPRAPRGRARSRPRSDRAATEPRVCQMSGETRCRTAISLLNVPEIA